MRIGMSCVAASAVVSGRAEVSWLRVGVQKWRKLGGPLPRNRLGAASMTMTMTTTMTR